jgi:hypothetical protein
MHCKLVTGALGCYRLSFSGEGDMLVCACSDRHGVTMLKFYETTSFKLIY